MTLSNVTIIDDEVLSAVPGGERSYLVTYQAESDIANESSLTVINDPLLPNRFQFYEVGGVQDQGAFPVNYKAKRPDRRNRRYWNIAITFSSEGTRRNQDNQDDPTQKDPVISGGGVRFSRVTHLDKDGDPITDTAGGLITGVEMDDYRSTLRIQQNLDTIDQTQFRDFTNSVNSATFFGLPARSWKMAPVRWEQRKKGTQVWYEVTFEFEQSSEPSRLWDRELIDRGHKAFDANNKLVKVKDEEGKATNIPQLLDGAGAQLDPNLPPVTIIPAFRLYDEKDFSLLGIPTSL